MRPAISDRLLNGDGRLIAVVLSAFIPQVRFIVGFQIVFPIECLVASRAWIGLGRWLWSPLFRPSQDRLVRFGHQVPFVVLLPIESLVAQEALELFGYRRRRPRTFRLKRPHMEMAALLQRRFSAHPGTIS